MNVVRQRGQRGPILGQPHLELLAFAGQGPFALGPPGEVGVLDDPSQRAGQVLRARVEVFADARGKGVQHLAKALLDGHDGGRIIDPKPWRPEGPSGTFVRATMGQILVGAKRLRRGQGTTGCMPSSADSLNQRKNNVTANTQLALAA